MAAGARRPTDWHPLAESDPVPGDPEAVRAEARRMVGLAGMLRAEAADLRAIAAQDELVGKYADALREESLDLERKLRETAERYEHVHGHLTRWASELEHCQATADGYLRQAQEARQDVAKSHGGGRPAADDDDDPVQQWRDALEKVVAHRDERAGHYAGLIRRRIKDVIADSGWENVKDHVHHHAKGLTQALTALGWIATALAVIAIFCTPPGWFVGLAVGIGVVLGAGHAALAASGDGDWSDVVMDAVALATLGLGIWAGRALGGVQAAARFAAGSAAAREAATAAFGGLRGSFALATRVLARAEPGTAREALALRSLDRLTSRVNAAGRTAREAVADATPARSAVGDAFKYGDREISGLVKATRELGNRFPDASAVQDTVAEAGVYARVAQGGWLVSAGMDVYDKGAQLKDRWGRLL